MLSCHTNISIESNAKFKSNTKFQLYQSITNEMSLKRRGALNHFLVYSSRRILRRGLLFESNRRNSEKESRVTWFWNKRIDFRWMTFETSRVLQSKDPSYPSNVVTIRIHNAWLYQAQLAREEFSQKNSRAIPVILFPYLRYFSRYSRVEIFLQFSPLFDLNV